MELMPDLDNTCHRCEQTVYPVERIDIGLVYHKGCFKCRTCALQLNLKTYHLDKRSENGGEIYCQNHMPRLGVANIDVDAVGIQTALSAPPARWSIFGGQVRASMYEAQSTDPAAPATTADDQNDDSNAESATLLTPSGRKTMTRYPTLKTYKDFEDHGIFEAQRELERKQKEEEDSLFKKFHLQKEERMRKLVEEIMAEKETSVKELVALFDRLGMKSPSRIIKGTPLVWKGAPKSAADDAGADDDDDDAVITEDQNLDDEASEGDTSATSLLEKSKHIDDEYQSRLDERMQELMRSLEQQEQEELAKLVEKHSKEMLSLIAEKVRASMYEAQSTDPAAPATTADEQNDDSNAESATLLTPSGRKTMTRYPTLKTYKDFEDHGIFEAQRELERKQKEEEDSLFKKFHLQKEERMRKLVEEIMAEKETSVKELVALFDRLGMKSPSRIIKGTPLVWKGAPKSAADDAGADDDNDDDDVITEDLNLDDEASEGDTSATSLLEKSKHIDDEYQSRLDERMQELMRSLEQQEQEELAKLVEKHSKEMLSLIAEKERAIDTENDFNRSLPPDVAPPEVKKMDLFEKSDSAVQRLDMQAIEFLEAALCAGG
ncbi:F-actin-monooxygenase MICAL3-like [Lingula anatina]|uniref:F-actin-monooxygenase MICAL3-like n=1 Tax=Lingula anatina TaxID=7574 RepID=A0A1S3IGC3_LINAN|nr:F-actin-monooxygenase MICAL3-like [Lingula anatina]|eukprot:XP_013396916.1 F-actin-monooxygenase MICAL3-like [Lingula anatina]